MRFRINKIRPLDDVLAAVIAAPLVIVIMVELSPALTASLAPVLDVLAFDSTFRRDHDDEYIREGETESSKKKLAHKLVKY